MTVYHDRGVSFFFAGPLVRAVFVAITARLCP
jgi:hypothetical protein